MNKDIIFGHHWRIWAYDSCSHLSCKSSSWRMSGLCSELSRKVKQYTMPFPVIATADLEIGIFDSDRHFHLLSWIKVLGQNNWYRNKVVTSSVKFKIRIRNISTYLKLQFKAFQNTIILTCHNDKTFVMKVNKRVTKSWIEFEWGKSSND